MILRCLLAFVLILGVAPGMGPGFEVLQESRLRVVEQINRDRAAAGLPLVIYSPELSAAADRHCREMLDEGYTSHWNRNGWKPYLRYADAGIRDATAENIYSMWRTDFHPSAESTAAGMLEGHRGFMAEQPPLDGHRRVVLDPNHTHVGIGVAAAPAGLRMIELFGARHAELQPLPVRATMKTFLRLRGRINPKQVKLFVVSIYYEPLPKPMTRAALQGTYSYSLPREERTERLLLQEGVYRDGSSGSIVLEPLGTFELPFRFWKGEPGVYTAVVWVQREGRPPFPGAMTSVMVER